MGRSTMSDGILLRVMTGASSAVSVDDCLQKRVENGTGLYSWCARFTGKMAATGGLCAQPAASKLRL